MAATAPKQVALELPLERLWLRATGDGWSLVDSNGDVVFRGVGRASRRQCLEFAREHGVLTVLT
jgi:hypothetical protein